MILGADLQSWASVVITKYGCKIREESFFNFKARGGS